MLLKLFQQHKNITVIICPHAFWLNHMMTSNELKQILLTGRMRLQGTLQALGVQFRRQSTYENTNRLQTKKTYDS